MELVSSRRAASRTTRRWVIPCETIADWGVIKGSRSPEFVVYLKSGERIRRAGLLGDFDELVGMINSYEAIPPRGHPDSDGKLKDREMRTQASRRVNWIMGVGLVLIGTVVVVLWRMRLLN